ncbi:MAG: ectonucleotide pyrophosphatase phosphodiesterase [Watsoniomyces obsoletus]|nr:MAG: ectonucleotide pyrophosphatase phosphodiesterase [Watsoniomyces obsoletus]
MDGYDGPTSSDSSDEDLISLPRPQLFNKSSRKEPSQSQNIEVGPGSPAQNKRLTNGKNGSQTFIIRVLDFRIPDSRIHPPPSADEDDGARVFVGADILINLGCFSGDWIRLEILSESGDVAPSPSEDVSTTVDWRPVKIYALPENLARRLSASGGTRNGRPICNGAHQPGYPAPVALAPDILIANLNNPTRVRIFPLLPSSTSSLMYEYDQNVSSKNSSPPLAKEVTLMKLATPFSTERSSQALLMAALKDYFQEKVRWVKRGDYVGVSINTALRDLVGQARSHIDDQPEVLELLSTPNQEAGQVRTSNLAWFKISDVSWDGSGSSVPEQTWGGLVAIDPSSTRMVQAGNLQSSIPKLAALSSGHGRTLPSKEKRNKDYNQGMKKHSVQLRQRLQDLISVAISPASEALNLPPLAVLLHSAQRGVGKRTLAQQACTDRGMHVFLIDAYDIMAGNGGGDVKTEGLLRARAERALHCGPSYCAIVIEHIEALTADRVFTALKDIIADSRVVIATTVEIEQLPAPLRALFTHELEVTVPHEQERTTLLQDTIKAEDIALAADVDLSSVALKTAALVAGDLVDVVDRAVAAKELRIKQLLARLNSGDETLTLTKHDLILAGDDSVRCVTKGDFDNAIDAARKNFSDSIGAPKIPTVNWEDVGGLNNVKEAVLETIQLPLEHPELFTKGMKKRSGVLFYGPPGTGKTLLAKAIATEFSLNFFSVKGPELLNMYIGESEANVRRVFQRARDARPCVVFFDELDSVAPKRGNQGDSGGVMDRIVSQLLAELDGMSGDDAEAGGVFVIGATNRPDLLDPALLRPGRFDKTLYLGLPDTDEKQLKILQALTRKFALAPEVSLARVAETLPFTYSGADIYALCSDAMLKAVTRRVSALEAKIEAMHGQHMSTTYYLDHLATEEDTAVVVSEDDFLAAERELVGSVSARELEHYNRVRQTFETKDKQRSQQHQIPG